MNHLHTFLTFIRKFWVTVGLCIVILILSVMHTETLPEAPVTNFDKFVHFLMYLTLSGVVFFDSTRYLRQAIGKRSVFLGSFLLPVLIGGLIEIIQCFLSYRTGDWWDFLSNTIGALIGFLICMLINYRLKPARK